MTFSKITKALVFTAMAGLSANAATAQGLNANHPLIANGPQLIAPGHINLPGHQPAHRNHDARNAVGALIALGVVAGAVHAANQPRVQNVRLQCPAGTQPHATPIGSGHGGLIHDGYRWVCTY